MNHRHDRVVTDRSSRIIVAKDNGKCQWAEKENQFTKITKKLQKKIQRKTIEKKIKLNHNSSMIFRWQSVLLCFCLFLIFIFFTFCTCIRKITRQFFKRTQECFFHIKVCFLGCTWVSCREMVFLNFDFWVFELVFLEKIKINFSVARFAIWNDKEKRTRSKNVGKN